MDEIMNQSYDELLLAKGEAKFNMRMARKEFEKKLANKEFDNIEEEYRNLMEIIDAYPVLVESIENDMKKVLRLEMATLCDKFQESEMYDSSSKMATAYFQLNIANGDYRTAAQSTSLICNMMKQPSLTFEERESIEHLYDFANYRMSILYSEVFPYLNNSGKQRYLMDNVADVFDNIQKDDDGHFTINGRAEYAIKHLLEIYEMSPELTYFDAFLEQTNKSLFGLKEILDEHFSDPEVVLSDDCSISIQLQELIDILCKKAKEERDEFIKEEDITK